MSSEALLAGRYQLQQLITADTLKEHWSARDVRLDRDVTVELVTASSAELRARFTSRARLLAANNHPQLVSVYDTGWQDGVPYAVLEPLPGMTLAERVERGPTALVSQVVEIGLALTGALAAALQRDLEVLPFRADAVVLQDQQHLKLTDLLLRTDSPADVPQSEQELVVQVAGLLAALALPPGAVPLNQPLRADMLPSALPATLRSILLATIAPRGASIRTLADLRQSLQDYRIATLGATRTFSPVGSASEERSVAADAFTGLPTTRAMPLPAGNVGARGSYEVRRSRRGGFGVVLLLMAILVVLAAGVGVAYWLGTVDVAPAVQTAQPTATPRKPASTPTVSSIIQNAPLFTPTPVGGPRSPTPTVGSQGQLGGIPATPTLGPADFTATAVAGQTATAAVLSETATAEPTPSPSATASPTPSPTATPTANVTEQVQNATPTPLPLIQVPDVIGQSFASATQLLAEDGLTVARGADQASNAVPAGNVITQVPVSGSLIPPDSQVLLIVSSGPPGIAIPKVQGLSVGAAEATLQNAGLMSFSTKQQPSSSVPQGTVMSQSPAAGTQVQPSQTVQLTVSAGNLIAVPNVVGMTEQQAQDTIKAAGLATTFANHSGHSPSVQVGQVESETPPAGKLVPPGTTVYINVRVS